MKRTVTYDDSAAADILTLTTATSADIDMDSLTAAASGDLTVADICGAVGCEDTIQIVDDPDLVLWTVPDDPGE